MARALSNKNKEDFAKLLIQWQDATQAIVNLFVEAYFTDSADDKPDTYWVADDIGGVLYINDYFFGVNDMIDFMRYDYTQEEVFEYYWYSLKSHESGESPMNICTYKKQLKS